MIPGAGRAPIVRPISLPPANSAIVGIDRMPKRSERSCSSSVFTLTTTETARFVGGDARDFRGDGEARTAPLRPEIDEHRQRRRIHERVERRGGRDVDGRVQLRQILVTLAAARHLIEPREGNPVLLTAEAATDNHPRLIRPCFAHDIEFYYRRRQPSVTMSLKG